MKLLALALGFVGLLRAQEIRLVQAASGIAAPTDIENAADGSGRLFLVQQNGIIRILRSGIVLPAAFLDISNRTRADGERGLLGLAFPPGFAQSGRFYVDYTDIAGDTVIAQYRVSAGNPNIAEQFSETVLLHIPQPFENHNGGQIRFGPDGYLYVAMGDGGSAGDPQRNGQNLGTLLGKLLRIDVESDPGHAHIPANNPFVNTAGARGEIWAYGLRNPWRFSFDRVTNDLWIGDVGQDSYEEIDFQPVASHGGENYGWNRMEGLHCYLPGCSQDGITLPVAEYSHADGCAVTGGFMYRGNGSPGLRGTYVYGDLCSGTIWGLSRQGNQWVSRRMLPLSGIGITTFGEDEAGEIYVANATNGTILKMIGSAAPRILPSGVVNAASFVPGLTAGSLATVFAAGVMDNPGSVSAVQIPLPMSLNGVSVNVNGISAPVLAVANQNGQEQVNFQVPFEAAGAGTASVVVTRAGNSSTAASVAMLDVQPAVYTTDGTQAIVVRNSDYSLATGSRPLVRGEFACVYASGLGRVTNQPATGAGAPSEPLAMVPGNVQVTIGGVAAEVQFAGLAPGFVGVYQVNFRVPAGVASGAVDLVVGAGGVNSPVVKAGVE
jgi:uncharacterized protein (TIGR03437 family)